MAQISLPKNSTVNKGKYYKDQTGSKNIRKVNVYRWDPSTQGVSSAASDVYKRQR